MTIHRLCNRLKRFKAQTCCGRRLTRGVFVADTPRAITCRSCIRVMAIWAVSGHDDGRDGLHPCTVAWQRFRAGYSNAFDGTAEGRDLDSRLQDAFRQGWLACDRTVRNAMEGRR